MLYELLVLARLLYGPQHGYLIAKVASDMLGPWAKVSPGSLYPTLARLVGAGLIAEVGPAPERHRDPRTYAITGAGRVRFRELMLDTASNPSDYQRRFHLKVPFLEFLASDERQELFDHYGEHCRTAIRYLEKETRLLLQYAPGSGVASPAGIDNAIALMAHQADQWRAELAWVGRLRERIAPSTASVPEAE